MVPYILVIKVLLKFQLDVFYLFICRLYTHYVQPWNHPPPKQIQSTQTPTHITKKHTTNNSHSSTQLNNIQFCFPQSTHTYGLQSTFEAPEDGRSLKHVEPTNK